MTYLTGSNILATDYNTFSTLAGSMNGVFGDLYPGATTLPNAAFGYGQAPVLTAVSPGQNVTAADWASLFTIMRNCGIHQGTSVVPPVPASGPTVGSDIIALNSPTAMSAAVALLNTNKLNIAAGQSFISAGTTYTQPGAVIPWTNTLTWTVQGNVGTWNNARHFFNTGGAFFLNGSYAPLVTPEDTQWANMLNAMSPLVFTATSTTPNTGTGGTAIGFYGLTTTYQVVYLKSYGGGGYYTNSYIQVEAKLAAAAGTNGLIDMRVTLVDNDSSLPKDPKNGATVYRIDSRRSSGVIAYTGPAATTTVGSNSGFVST